MSTQWISVSERLPDFGKYVLVRRNQNNWHDSTDQENVNVIVMKRVSAEAEGNNRVPYEWHQFGPMRLFGQHVSYWTEIPAMTNNEGKK